MDLDLRRTYQFSQRRQSQHRQRLRDFFGGQHQPEVKEEEQQEQEQEEQEGPWRRRRTSDMEEGSSEVGPPDV